MTNEDAIKWLENLKQDIGQLRYENLWPYAQAIDEIIDMLDEQDASGWVSVKDRLPPMYHIVLITGNDSAGRSFGVIKGSCDGDEGKWYRDDIGQYVDSRGDTVTHWMPLPDQPKEEKKS